MIRKMILAMIARMCNFEVDVKMGLKKKQEKNTEIEAGWRLSVKKQLSCISGIFEEPTTPKINVMKL